MVTFLFGQFNIVISQVKKKEFFVLALFTLCVMASNPVLSQDADVVAPPTPGSNAAMFEEGTSGIETLLRESLNRDQPQNQDAQAQQGQQALPTMSNVTAQTPQSPGLILPMDGRLPEPEKSAEELEQELRDEAFDASLTGMLPLTPAEIRRFLEAYDETQEAVQTPHYDYPDPVLGLETLSLEPGQAPQEVNAAVGFVTTVNFVDLSGEPWPIQDIGWAGEFEILQPEQGGNVIRITPLSEFARGNMSVRLVGLKAPVVITIKTVRDKVHYRLDLRVPDYGPGGTPPVIDTGVQTVAGSSEIVAFLEGVAPERSEKLIVSGVDGRSSAYKLDGKTYFRTPLTLLSPAWTSSVKSADGTTVYELDDAPVLLLSDNGEMKRAFLKEDVEENDF